MGLLLPHGRYRRGNRTSHLKTGLGLAALAGRGMTNTLAIGLVILIVGGLALDQYLQDGAMALFLSRQFVLLIDWIKFWA